LHQFCERAAPAGLRTAAHRRRAGCTLAHACTRMPCESQGATPTHTRYAAIRRGDNRARAPP
jgi:hypothetical protein